VLIGSGADNLTVTEAVEGFVRGVAEAYAPGSNRGALQRVRLVEWRFDRAQQIIEALERVSRLPAVSAWVELRCSKYVARGEGGGVADEHGLALVLAAAALLARTDGGPEALAAVLAQVPSENDLRAQAEAKLARLLDLSASAGAGAGDDALAINRGISVRLQPAATGSAQAIGVGSVDEAFDRQAPFSI